MADIVMSQTHSHPTDEARSRCVAYIEKIKNQFGLSVRWTDNVCSFSGPAKGILIVSEKSVDIEIKLGFAAKMIRRKIEDRLGSGLKDALR